MKNQKGITLVALVITIIVMLILVGVSVTVALKGGLFTTAKNASQNTMEARDAELELDNDGRIKIGGIWYDSIEKYQQKIPSENQSGSVEEEGGEGGSGGTETEGGSGGEGTGAILIWTHADDNSNDTFDVGEVVTASNGESFYVIATPGANDETVKLLAVKCVDTRAQIDGETNTNYNKQSDDYNTVAFDLGEYDENNKTYYKPDTTTSVTNVYANASIRGLVESYVIETLGLEANQGRLMSEGEATSLISETDNILSVGFINFFWLGTSDPEFTEAALRYSCGSVGSDYVYQEFSQGLRPVIEISKTDIQ